MTAEAQTCPHCGQPVTGESYYCGSCGKAVAPSDRPVPNRKQTVLGVMPGVLPVPAPAPEPEAPAAPSAESEQRTTDVGISEPPVGAMGRTVLGMPSAAQGSGTGETKARAPDVSGKAFAKTMLGVMPAVPAASAGAPAPQASESAPTPAARSAAAGGIGGARTLLGVAASLPPKVEQPRAEPPAAAPAPAPEPVRSTGSRKADPARTVLGMDEDAPPAEAPRAARASAPSTPRMSRASVPGARRWPAPPVLALAVLALIGAGALGYLALRGHGPDVRVRVVSDAEGESMLFEVPGVAAGAKLRFGGQEKPLEAGRASFPLAADSLRVGKNAVLYDVVQPSGEIESGRVALSVDYRVTLDTAPLRAGKAAVDVVVSALPGSQVQLDGQAVQLDAQGRAVRSDPLELSSAAGHVEHVVKYRVQPPAGEASVGEVRALIPVTMLQIDTPGLMVVTDREQVEIAGAVDKDAKLTIDGAPLDVRAGRFLHNYALPQVGEYSPKLLASSQGKAPREVVLNVRRVADLAKAAQGFDPDRGLSYAKIAKNPAIYRGQRVEFEGRVYNVNVEGGKSALQVLVRACPRGERCPLWVSYASATELTVDSWVRVLGVVAGEQQFRSETEQVKSVPKVDAVFLLPIKP